MKVLVAAATKHNSTGEIAEEIGKVLRGRGLTVVVTPPGKTGDVGDYDAFVLGSGVYAGHWLKPARELAEKIGAVSGDPPVWLFSSGPVGDPPRPEEDPVDVSGVTAVTGAREHQVFPGRIIRQDLGFAERAVVAALRVPEGDFRDWAKIRTWAEHIADALDRPA